MKLPAWDLQKAKTLAGVVRQEKSVHFASHMDLCHLQRVKLAKHLQKYSGPALGEGRRRQWIPSCVGRTLRISFSDGGGNISGYILQTSSQVKRGK